MALLQTTDDAIKSVADEIRAKGSTAEFLSFPDDFIDAIEALSSHSEGNWKQEYQKYIAGDVFSIPDIITDLRDFAFALYGTVFSNAMLAEIPDTLQTIGDYCFNGCTGITAIDFSEKSLQSIGEAAFKNCTAVTSLDLSDNDLQTIGVGTCVGMSALTTIDLSGNPHLKDIPDSFADYVPLTSVDVTDCPIETIGAYAFRSSGNRRPTMWNFFKNISSLKSIGAYAFAWSGNRYSRYELDMTGCTSLETIGASAFRGPGTTNSGNGWSTITFPASLEIIDEFAFRGADIQYIDFSRCVNLEEIRGSAFLGHNSYAAVDVDLSACSALYLIGGNCFGSSLNYRRVNSLTLPPHTLDEIGAGAFRQTRLANQGELTIRALTIGEYAFYGCTGITKVHIYDCLTYGVYVFGADTALTEAHIHTKPTSFPSGITTNPLFRGCTALTDIYVPWSAGEVPENYFIQTSQTGVTFHYNYVWQ